MILWNEVLGQPIMNEGGIAILESDNNIIAYNNVLQNDWAGISIRLSNHVAVKGNNIVDHSWWGLIIADSGNITIHCNNFIDNTMQFHLDNLENISWSLAGYGNFWSDYTGKDENNDGIGESPYFLEGDEVDNYPLTGKCYFFEVERENRSFIMEVISNSTINSLEHLSNTSHTNQVVFNVSDLVDKRGFLIIRFIDDLMRGPYGAIVDDEIPLMIKEIAIQEHSITLYVLYFHGDGQTSVTICRRLLTDLSIDGYVGIDDLVAAGEAFHSNPAHPRWHKQADIDQNGLVNILDLLAIAKDFGKSWI